LTILKHVGDMKQPSAR